MLDCPDWDSAGAVERFLDTFGEIAEEFSEEIEADMERDERQGRE